MSFLFGGENRTVIGTSVRQSGPSVVSRFSL